MKAIKNTTITSEEIIYHSCEITDLAMALVREEVLKVAPNHPLWSKPQYRPELDYCMTEEVQDIFDGLYDRVRWRLEGLTGFVAD